jgi:hypothetical protein
LGGGKRAQGKSRTEVSCLFWEQAAAVILLALTIGVLYNSWVTFPLRDPFSSLPLVVLAEAHVYEGGKADRVSGWKLIARFREASESGLEPGRSA